MFSLFHIFVISTVFGEPWYSIPLKLTANKEHFITTISFGSPIAFDLDIILDTGSGKFHIYPTKYNNITTRNILPYDSNSFQCICQPIVSYPKHETVLTEFNDTWYQFDRNTLDNDTNDSSIDDYFIPFLSGCPVFNDTKCELRGAQCIISNINVTKQSCTKDDEDDEEDDNDDFCEETLCKASQSLYRLLVNDEEASFGCAEHCYSGIDIISFKYSNTTKHNHVPYVYADSIILDEKGHDPPIYNDQSWADGNLGLVYDEEQTSFWQILGIESHSALVAFDTMDGRIDIGNVSEVYNDLIEYSSYIWWDASYHYMYIYSLSVCNIDLFSVLGIGSYYLAMIDTGATCLTLPPEIFDVLFKYIPYGLDCTSNNTFCYIPNDIDDMNDYTQFAMISFQFSMKNDSKVFYISLKDLVIRLADKGIRYCIERGTHSVSKITTCTPQDTGSKVRVSHDCADRGVIIFGTKALQSLYTIFDYPNIRIGFGNNIKLNYTQRKYDIANGKTCKKKPISCIGDDVLNLVHNICESGVDKCELYWGWKYDKETHFCVLQNWLYVAIPITWFIIMILLLIFVRVKMWIDQNIYYSAIKV